MDINEVMKKSKILRSEKAEEGADNLLLRLDNGDIGMEVLQESYTQYTGELEEADFESYKTFLQSANGKKICALLED